MNFAFLILLCPLAFSSTDDCWTWFERTGLKKGRDCMIECSIAETDMGTFHCPEQCGALCKKQAKNHFYLALSKVYPTLTQAEKELVAKRPKEMLTAYRMRWQAESLCLDIFEESGLNDESDACRHFAWAALLYKKLGIDLSQKILNAHEESEKQPVEQKSMDLANNKSGLTAANHLEKKNKLNNEEIIKSFERNLKEGNLVVLEPGAKRSPSKSSIKPGKLKRKKKHNKQKEAK